MLGYPAPSPEVRNRPEEGPKQPMYNAHGPQNMGTPVITQELRKSLLCKVDDIFCGDSRRHANHIDFPPDSHQILRDPADGSARAHRCHDVIDCVVIPIAGFWADVSRVTAICCRLFSGPTGPVIVPPVITRVPVHFQLDHQAKSPDTQRLRVVANILVFSFCRTGQNPAH